MALTEQKYRHGATGSENRDVSDKLREVVSVLDFGADNTGVADCRDNIASAITHLSSQGGGTLLFPAGTYKLATYGSAGHIEMTNLDNINIIGYGAVLDSPNGVGNRYVFALDGCRNITIEGFDIQGTYTRSGSIDLTAGISAFTFRSSTRDSNSIYIKCMRAQNVYSFMNSVLTDVNYRVRGISIDNCLIFHGYYGINFANNGDLLSVRNLRTSQVVRSYFPYGVSNHDVQYSSYGGDTFTDCLIKAYEYDTTDIRVHATILANSSADSKVVIESQHVTATQPTPAVLKNIYVEMNDSTCTGSASSVRFAYWKNGVQEATCATTIFDNITLQGNARKHIDFAVAIPTDSGLIDLSGFIYDTAGSISPYTVGFYERFGKGAVGNSTGSLSVDGITRHLGSAYFSANDKTTLLGYFDGTVTANTTFIFQQGAFTLEKGGSGYAAGTKLFDIPGQTSSSFGFSCYEGANSGTPNAANAVVKIGQMATTGRSVNAAGTLNASGADYAEYERNNGLQIAKGSVVGFKADGTLTRTFSEAVRFAIKSTDPSFVGGDNWASAEIVGLPPVPPVRRKDVFEDERDGDGRKVTVLVEAGDSDEEWAQMEAAYQAANAEFQIKVETERVKYDRIAYAGKVPVNVTGATPGGYIIAADGDDGEIIGEFVSDPDFSQYKRAVGRVNRILDDGRCEVAVIIH